MPWLFSKVFQGSLTYIEIFGMVFVNVKLV